MRPDYGPDFYAGITYNNLPAAHDPVLIAWASNPGYAQATPTSPWRNAMSVPRSMRLKKAGNTFYAFTTTSETVAGTPRPGY